MEGYQLVWLRILAVVELRLKHQKEHIALLLVLVVNTLLDVPLLLVTNCLGMVDRWPKVEHLNSINISMLSKPKT